MIWYLKKQSQFAGRQIDVKSCMKVTYGDKPPCGTARKQSQSKPILSFGVLRAAFRVLDLKKQSQLKPIVDLGN
jgi:hypothetical protein